MFIGGSCFPRVLVIEFEGKLCLHQAWRDTLGQQRGPAQPELYRPCGGGGEKIEATGLLLHSDIYHVSLVTTESSDWQTLTRPCTIYGALPIWLMLYKMVFLEASFHFTDVNTEA